jgi:hypothetical protein
MHQRRGTRIAEHLKLVLSVIGPAGTLSLPQAGTALTARKGGARTGGYRQA